MLASELLEEMKNGSERDMKMRHFGLGRWLRNNWALWKGSKLSKHFNKHGVFHPDDMSAIILTAFWRNLNNKPLKLEEEFSFYNRYWAVREEPKEIPCENGKYRFGLHDDRNPKLPRFIHVAECKSPNKYIVYEFKKGWYDPDQLVLSRIKELSGENNLVSAPLIKPARKSHK